MIVHLRLDQEHLILFNSVPAGSLGTKDGKPINGSAGGKEANVEEDNLLDATPPHEIGHTLGLEDHTGGIMNYGTSADAVNGENIAGVLAVVGIGGQNNAGVASGKLLNGSTIQGLESGKVMSVAKFERLVRRFQRREERRNKRNNNDE